MSFWTKPSFSIPSGPIIPGVDNPVQSGNSTLSQAGSALGINPQGINIQNTIATIADPVMAGGNAISRVTGGSGNVMTDAGIGGFVGNTGNMTYSGMGDAALIGGAVLGGAYLGGADLTGTSADMVNAGDTPTLTGTIVPNGGATDFSGFANSGTGTDYNAWMNGVANGGSSGGSMSSLATPSAGGTTFGQAMGQTAGNMGTMATVGAGLKLAAGIYGLIKSSQNPNVSNTPSPAMTTATNSNAAASTAASGQLTAAMADPNVYYNSAQYQTGLQAVERTDASQGYSGSGKMMADLQNYGATSYQAYLTNLASIAGTTLNAASGAQTSGTNITQASNQNNSLTLQSEINALNLIGGTIGQIGSSNPSTSQSAGF
jgi:hypothetical protein